MFNVLLITTEHIGAFYLALL